VPVQLPMLEPANNAAAAAGLTRAAERTSSSTTEGTRRFGLAALTAARRGATPLPAGLSRGRLNVPSRDSAEVEPATAATQDRAAQRPEPARPQPAQAETPTAAEPAADVTATPAEEAAPATAPAAPTLSSGRFVEPTPLPPVEQVREEARNDRSQAALQLVTAQRQALASRAAASRSNRVQSGSGLSALRDTTGPGPLRASTSLLRSDGEARGTSLFDLPSSGQGLLGRLNGRSTSASPLNALRNDDEQSGLRSLSGVNSQRAGLRSLFQSNDDDSRRLLSLSNPNRTTGGFGLASATRSALDLIG
jgi:hypothetical protein